MRISADTDVCIGAGNCVLTDPDTFDQDDDGIVVVLRDDLDGLDRAARDAAEVAVRRCPSGALSLTGPGRPEV